MCMFPTTCNGKLWGHSTNVPPKEEINFRGRPRVLEAPTTERLSPLCGRVEDSKCSSDTYNSIMASPSPVDAGWTVNLSQFNLVLSILLLLDRGHPGPSRADFVVRVDKIAPRSPTTPHMNFIVYTHVVLDEISHRLDLFVNGRSSEHRQLPPVSKRQLLTHKQTQGARAKRKRMLGETVEISKAAHVGQNNFCNNWQLKIKTCKTE